MGSSLNVFSACPWIRGSASVLLPGEAQLSGGSGMEGQESHPARTVSPGEWPGNSCARCTAWLHTRVLLPAFHSEKQNPLSKEKVCQTLVPEGFSTALQTLTVQCGLWTNSKAITGEGASGTRNENSQAPPWAYGVRICISIKFPGDSHSLVHNEFEKHWPKLSSSELKGSRSRWMTALERRRQTYLFQ